MIAINQDNLHLTPAGENTLVGGIPARWLRVLSARLPHTHLSFRIVQETFVGAYQILAFGASRFVWRVKEGVVNLISRIFIASRRSRQIICIFSYHAFEYCFNSLCIVLLVYSFRVFRIVRARAQPAPCYPGRAFAKRPYFNSISRKLACQKKRSLSGLRFLFGSFFKMLFVRMLFVRRSEDFKGSVIEKHANFLYSPFFFFGRLGSGRGKLKSCGLCVSVFLPWCILLRE